MRVSSGAVLLAAVLALSQPAWASTEASQAGHVDPEIKVYVNQAEKEHDQIIEHLTDQLLGISGHASSGTPEDERMRMALSAEPVFLQLEHAVRSHVEHLNQARAKHQNKMNAAAQSLVSSASQRASGILMGSEATAKTCFACIYLMQRAMAETEPYYSPAVQQGTAAALSNAARHVGTGARGIPVSRPLQSAYQTKNLPINDPEPENGTPLMQPGSGMNGWAPVTSPLSLHGPRSHPITNAEEQLGLHGDSGANDFDAKATAEKMRIPGLDRELWPQLHFGEDEDGEESEESGDEEEEEDAGDGEEEEEEEEDAGDGGDEEEEEDAGDGEEEEVEDAGEDEAEEEEDAGGEADEEEDASEDEEASGDEEEATGDDDEEATGDDDEEATGDHKEEYGDEDDESGDEKDDEEPSEEEAEDEEESGDEEESDRIVHGDGDVSYGEDEITMEDKPLSKHKTDSQFLQEGATAKATAAASKGKSPQAAFLQSQASARSRVGASLTAAVEAAAQDAPPSEDAPPEAYEMYADPPSIGPRIPPPLDNQHDVLPSDDTRPLRFDKHMGAPINYLPTDTGPAPPMVAPAGLLRALEHGFIPRMAPANQGTLPTLGSGMGLTDSGPLLVAERDSSGKVKLDSNNLPKMNLVDLRDHSQNPYPRPHSELFGSSSFIQERARGENVPRASEPAPNAPMDASSFLQAQTRSRGGPAPLGSRPFHVPDDFHVAEVPENAYFMRAIPPAVGPNAPVPLPNMPGISDRPVWSQQMATPDTSGASLPGTPGQGIEGFHNDLIPMTPDGGVAPMTMYPPIYDVRTMDMTDTPAGGPPPVTGDAQEAAVAAASSASAAAAQASAASLLQEAAAAGAETTRSSSPIIPPVAAGQQGESGMIPSLSGSNAAVAGLNSRDGKHDVGLKSKPTTIDGDTLAQMIQNPGTVFDGDVRSPDMDLPPFGTDQGRTTFLPVSTTGDRIKIDTSFLQRKATVASLIGSSKSHHATREVEEEAEAEEGEAQAGEEEPGVPAQLAAGWHRPLSRQGLALSEEEESERAKAVKLARGSIPGVDRSMYVQGGDNGGPEGATGPSYGCDPDHVDGSGSLVQGSCRKGAEGLGRIRDKLGEETLFDKYVPSHARAHHNWPTTDGREASPTDGLAGGPTEGQKVSKGIGGMLSKMGSKFMKSKVAVPSPSPIPIGFRGPSTGGGEVGSRFADWNDPDSGLFNKPVCTTEELGKKPVINDITEIDDPEDCFHRTWLADQMKVKVGKKSKMYPKEKPGRLPRWLKKLQKAIRPKKGLFSLLQADAAAGDMMGAASAGSATAKANARARVHERRQASKMPEQPRLAETRAKAESKAKAMRAAAAAARAEAQAKVRAAAAARAGFDPGRSMTFLKEQKRPVPHYCRKSDGGLCRQRLRAPSPWQLKRLYRRTAMESRIAALQAKWERALERICSSVPAIGQPRPPLAEGTPGAAGTADGSGSGGLLGKLSSSMGKLKSLKNSMGMGGYSKEIKTNANAPKGGVDGLLRTVDKVQESGYEGPRPPPRLQSEGLASNGKVEPQPFTAYVTEPTPYGDRPAVGQMTDLGMAPLLAEQCSLLVGKLRSMADLFLHSYDLEEACVEVKMCKNTEFGISHSSPPTSVKARMYGSLMG